MSDEDDDIVSLIGGVIVAVATGYILYRVGKSLFWHITESGTTELLTYVPDPAHAFPQAASEQDYES